MFTLFIYYKISHSLKLVTAQKCSKSWDQDFSDNSLRYALIR